MTYYESAQGVGITRRRAIQEIKAHDADIEEFFAECGEYETYSASEVLDWLGY